MGTKQFEFSRPVHGVQQLFDTRKTVGMGGDDDRLGLCDAGQVHAELHVLQQRLNAGDIDMFQSKHPGNDRITVVNQPPARPEIGIYVTPLRRWHDRHDVAPPGHYQALKLEHRLQQRIEVLHLDRTSQGAL